MSNGIGSHSSQDPTVIIIGGGLSGIAAPYRCRRRGLDARILESGPRFGGVRHWNRYPGAGVDSGWLFCRLNIPEVYETWSFSERYPDHNELSRCIAHVDKTLDLSKDTLFNTKVVGADFDTSTSRWTGRTASGMRMSSKYLILATGLLHKQYMPDFPGLESYDGRVVHSASWPKNLDVQNCKVGVFGSGATAVQIVQEVAKKTAARGSPTVLMRRPTTCAPLRQQRLSVADQDKWRGYFPTLFAASRSSRTGFSIANTGKAIAETPEAEREAHLEALWNRGAFNFLLGGYIDTATDLASNRIIYDFWARKVGGRISDPIKKDIMAPLEPIYPFGTKRPPLENDYYECLDTSHVEIVPLTQNHVERFTEGGIVLKDGSYRPLDMVILATGFDGFTGSLSEIGIRDKVENDLGTIWKSGVRTYLGMCLSGFPNTFILYSPQAPTALSNGPTILECQADMIIESIARLEAEGARTTEATRETEYDWPSAVDDTMDGTLFAGTNSWWNGGNLPGKKIQNLIFNGGIADYEKFCRGKLEDWTGFEIQRF